jgi:hypothetical protein
MSNDLGSLMEDALERMQRTRALTRPPPVSPLVELEVCSLDWLWPGRLAVGKVGLLIGEPDCGKSLLAITLAAHVSSGRPWPDGAACPRGTVLLLAGEDDLSDTVNPRLLAANANVEGVMLFHPEQAATNPLTLPDQLDRLEYWIAQDAEMRLVIFDPLAAFFRGLTGETAMRKLLGQLNDLARRRQVAILGIVHLNRKIGGKAIYGATGAMALAAAARHVYTIGRDPAEPTRRVMAQIKNNLAAKQRNLAFRIVTGEMGIPLLEWLDAPQTLEAEDLLRMAEQSSEASGALADAREWLQSQLSAGPLAASLLQQKARNDGIAWRTVQRAKRLLGIASHRPLDGSHAWLWSLPAKPKQAPK